MEFSRPEYWSGKTFPSPEDLPNPRIEPRTPALQVDSLPAEPQGKPKNTGVGSLSLLQRILLTQESNQGLLNCRWILYQLSYQESPGQDTWYSIPEFLPQPRQDTCESQGCRRKAPCELGEKIMPLPCTQTWGTSGRFQGAETWAQPLSLKVFTFCQSSLGPAFYSHPIQPS